MNKLAKDKKTSKSFKQARNWIFTDFSKLELKAIYERNKDIIRYLCFGLEKCPSTKKEHFQGWIQFVNKKTMGGVKRIFGSKKLHLEPCIASPELNDKYCSKDGKFTSYGSWKYQGQRTDLEQLKKDINDNKPMKEIANDHFSNFIRYHSGIYKYRQLILKEQTRRFRQIEVVLRCGSTGTNKTRTAVESNPDAYLINGYNLKWFDGYEGEKTLIIDEYNNDVPITQLLKLLDGYQLRLPIKGGFSYANWNKVVITSNLKHLHSNARKEHLEALNRRITKRIDSFNDIAEVSIGNTISIDEYVEESETDFDLSQF